MNNLIVDIARKRFKDAGSQIVHFVDDAQANSILNGGGAGSFLLFAFIEAGNSRQLVRSSQKSRRSQNGFPGQE